MSVVTHPPEVDADQDTLDERVDEWEALIEEARQLARRRRRRNGAVALAALIAAAAATYAGGEGLRVGTARSADGDAQPAAALDRSGSWSVPTGPPGFRAGIVLHPTKQGALYLNTGGRVFRSMDSGRTWKSGPPIALRIDALTVDPRNGSILYAGTTDGVLKSTDGGRTWRRSGLAPTPNSRGREGFEGWVWSIAVDPADSRNVYAVRNGYAPGQSVFRSRDAGATWHVVRLSTAQTVTEIHAAGSGILYAAISGTRTGILRSTDAGTTWHRVLWGDWSLTVDPDSEGTVWAVGVGAGVVLVTRNGGTTWRSAGPTPAGDLTALALDPRRPRALYLSTRQSGVFHSVDDGRTWRPFGGGRKGRPVRGPGLTELLAIDPLKPGTAYAGDGFGVVATVNGGATWRRADAGVVASKVGTVAPAASNPTTIYTGGSALSRSDNGGRTWIALQTDGTAFAKGLRIDSGELAVDPRDHRHVLVGGRGISGSRDGGTTFSSLVRLPNDWVGKIAFAPGDPRQVYAVVYTTAEERNRVIRSSDGGNTWRVQPRAGIASLMSFAVHPKRADTVYAGYETWQAGSEGLTSTGGGVATSSDGGRSWRYRSIPDTNQVRSLAVAPSDPDTIYAATDAGLARSVDGGDRWQLLPYRSWDLSIVVVDPERSETVYLGTSDHGVLRSTDGGATWRAFAARLPRHDVQALAFDPSGKWLYAGTNDAGLTSIRVR
ncbi:WD40/YVTN/BNR-like repeat-containing protein [Gaiella sp.]|uniref:WD40/YVTN/BNR-like repeat-containing protein n=1 Tax=Gaiella sp. TaxID=2663207 RepID=UPI003983A024